MSLINIEKTIELDVYDHDTTPSVIKTIQMDTGTRTVFAVIQNSRQDYDIGQNATVSLTVLRPDKTKVQVTGQTFVCYTGTDGTMYGAKAELSDVALAVKGNLKAQFKITSGEQELRTEIFAINNGEALDADDGDWAGDLDGHNLDEMAQDIEDTKAAVSEMESDVSDLKEGLTAIEKPSRNLYEIDQSYKSTLGGITVEASTNQVIVRGTATANVSFVLPTVFEMTANQKYTFSGCPDGGGENTYRMDVRNETDDSLASTVSYDYGSGFVGYFSTTKRIRLGIRVISGTTINATFKPMILKGEMLGTDFIPHLTAYDDIARSINDAQDATISEIGTALKNATGYNLTYGRNVLTFVLGSSGSSLVGMLDNTYSYVIFNWFTDLSDDFPLSPTATGFIFKFGNRTRTGAGAAKLLIAIDMDGNIARGKISGSGVVQWFTDGASDITVAMFGDSITWGRDGASSSAIQVNETIPMIVNEMLGVNTINYGVGSQGWITTQFISTTALDNIASRDLSGADVITLAYGINDSDSPLGVYTDTGTTTIMGCIYNALQEIYRQNPSATIILIAPFGSVTSGITPVWLDNTARPGGWTLVEMREEYRKFAEYYHLPYVSCADAPINRFTPREMLPDGIHPNQQAYIILGRYIAGQISRFIC